ncbi:MAG: hypothetical protein WA150_07810, partial [Methylovirgula sp.]
VPLSAAYTTLENANTPTNAVPIGRSVRSFMLLPPMQICIFPAHANPRQTPRQSSAAHGSAGRKFLSKA